MADSNTVNRFDSLGAGAGSHLALNRAIAPYAAEDLLGPAIPDQQPVAPIAVFQVGLLDR
jgi:hypothetical protein